MKLSPITFIIIGLCVCIMCLTFGFINYAPNMKETKARNDNRDLAQTEAGKRGRATKRVEEATKIVQQEAAIWRSIVAAKTPTTDLRSGGINVSENSAQLMVDSRSFCDAVQSAVNKQLRIGGVKIVGEGPKVPEPGESAATILADYYNYPAIPFPVVIFDLGTVTVTGTYEQICENVRAWSRMPNFLAVADGLRLEGTSPHLTGSYAVSIVGYVHAKRLFAKLPEVPGSTGASGFGGPGGPMGRGGGPGAGMGVPGPGGMMNRKQGGPATLGG